MPTQEAKAHRVGEWARLRNTSSEIAEAIFEVAHYDEKLAEKIWEEGSDEVLIKAFEKTNKDSLFWGEQTIERKTSSIMTPRLHGEFLVISLYFAAAFSTLSNLSIGQKPFASIGQPFSSSVTRCAGDFNVNTCASRSCCEL